MRTLDRQIRYFLRIAELGSISRTVESLGLTQSGLSRQVTALETYLGKPLFTRTGRGVVLTVLGQQLFDIASPAYAAVDRGLQMVREVEENSEDVLSVAAVHTLNYYFTVDVARAFAEYFPNVGLTLISRSASEVAELVEVGRADVGLIYDTAVVSPSLSKTNLFEDRMCFICRKKDGVEDGVDLSTGCVRIVGFPKNYALRRMLDNCGLNLEFAAIAETVDVMLALVSSGVGGCVLPVGMPDALLEHYGLRKVPIAKPLLSRWVVSIVRADHPVLGILKKFIDAASEMAAARERYAVVA